MNRGINGEKIFPDDRYKATFVRLLAENVLRYRMRLLAYCVMDNHYHLVLENASGKLSDFFKGLNTGYAFYYRKGMGGQGYVFQSRFVSTFIQDEAYLKMAILYVLQNPVNARIVPDSRQYPWSSVKLNDAKSDLGWLDVEFVRELFGGSEQLDESLQTKKVEKLQTLKTRFGPFLGDDSFVEKAMERYELSGRPDAEKRKRQDDFSFEPESKVTREFEKAMGVNLDRLDTKSTAGKRLRAELLVRLRDLAGMKFREIAELPVFSDLHYLSLAHIYQNHKRRTAHGYTD